MIPKEEMKQLIERLKTYYPNRAGEASDILLYEYNLSVPLASSIMYLISILMEKHGCFNWPMLNVRMQPFHIN